MKQLELEDAVRLGEQFVKEQVEHLQTLILEDRLSPDPSNLRIDSNVPLEGLNNA